jgi:hypothetical protein
MVQVLPHGAPPTPQAALGLRAWLVAALGEDAGIAVAPAIAYGDEERAASSIAEPGSTLRVMWVDLAATPEPETHGRLLAELGRAGLPLLVLADEAAFARRFAALPQRVAERRAAWAALAQAGGAGFVAVNLEAPDLAGAARTYEGAAAA